MKLAYHVYFTTDMIYCQNKRTCFQVKKNPPSMSRLLLHVRRFSFLFLFVLSYRLVKTGEYNPSRYPFIATFSLNDRDGNGLKEE